MDLYLRKVHHPQARNNFRVILKLDGDEIEIGSIGTQSTTAINSVCTNLDMWHRQRRPDEKP